MKQFKLRDVLVNVPRCQITNAGETVAVEPKAMAVLAYLASHAGEVISQETLFEALWPNRIFSPGSVQRCIAQLRKALNDDAKQSVFITTHSKRGYSLDVEPVPLTPSSTLKRPRYITFALLSVLVIISFLVFRSDQAVQLSGKLTPITSTSHTDFYPTFSDDGKQLAFIRQTGSENQIILSPAGTSDNSVLISSEDNYQSLAWSADNLTLFFVIRQSDGDTIKKVDVTTGQITDVTKLSEGGDIWRIFPFNHLIYYSVASAPLNQTPHSKLYQLDMLTGESKVLIENSKHFTPYRFALAKHRQAMAVAGEGKGNSVEFRLLELQDNTLSAPFATLPLGFTEINWHPNEEYLLVHHLNKLYLLSLNGTFDTLPYNSYLRIFNPTFGADGTTIVMSQTAFDTDLSELDIQSGTSSAMVDSGGEDHLGKYSPDAEQLAFVSVKSGVQQVFITHEGRHTLVFKNEDNHPIYRSPVWNDAGDKLAFSFANELYIYSLEDQSIENFTMLNEFTSVLDWYSSGEDLLVATKRNNQSFFEKLTIASGKLSTLAPTGVNFHATLDNNDELVFAKEGVLYWGNQTFENDLFLEAQNQFFPYQKGVVFQAADRVYLFDKQNISVLVDRVPDSFSQLQDVHASGKLLFLTSVEQSAKLVLLE